MKSSTYNKSYSLNDTICFYYKNRFVKCIVLRIDEKGILGQLLTDYLGKNEDWYSGESKYFNKKEMKL